MRRAALAVAAALVLLAPGAARSSAPGDVKLIGRGLDRAVANGSLTTDEAAEYRADLQSSYATLRKLGGGRERNLGAVLHDVALQWKGYTSPRAYALFSMLKTNAGWFGNHAVPAGKTDIADADGVVYRFFPGQGFQLHPLADAGALNAKVAAGDIDGAEELALALAARGVPGSGALRFEYYFPFGGGRPPWTSGMAQAVMAQAFARASTLTGDTNLLNDSVAIFHAVQLGLVRQLAQGPWIRLYSFDPAVVLNAQLQAILSLEDYAAESEDVSASTLAASMLASAQQLLPRFDTGYWSLYSLAGDESPLEYHTYVIQLLTKLAARHPDGPWADVAARFTEYRTQPPSFRAGPAPGTLYPRPADGYKDAAPIRFWLSKRSRVTVSAGGRATTAWLSHGSHTLAWSPGPSLRPGSYRPTLSAVDLAGNKASLPLPPITVAWDTAAPDLTASATGRRLTWSATDPGTPWLDLRVLLAANGKHVLLRLGRRGLAGSRTLRLPRGRWSAALVAANSAGKRARVPLGVIP
jgi:D-glucuronyl C5-epimerase-like protein